MPDVAIVGVGEADEMGSVPHKSALQMHAEAARNALDDAGIPLSEVDAYLTCGNDFMPTLVMGEYIGLRPDVYMDSTSIGGSSFVAHVEHALHLIRSGIANVALITHGETRRANAKRGVRPRPASDDPLYPDAQFEHLYGLSLAAPPFYAMSCSRHMHEYGTTSEQLAEIAVATRGWAQKNPKAFIRDPLTIEDVLASPMLAYPLHVLDCCLVTDAGGAVVVTSAQRAKATRKSPVWVLGAGSAFTHLNITTMPDLTVTPAAISGPKAFGEAGVKPDEIDVAEIYDSFTYTVLVVLEDLGFCEKGEGGAFVSDQRTAPGGDFPLNTSGGGLSYTHPGMFGVFLLIEATRQLRGECGDRQVEGARLGCVNGTGGYLSSTATLILGAD